MIMAARPSRSGGCCLLLLLLSCSTALVQNTPVIVCASSNELERAIGFFCKSEDHVLELGSQYASVSKKICHVAESALLVDVARFESKSGRCTYRDTKAFQSMPTVHVVDLPALQHWKDVIIEANTARAFDVVVVDLGHMTGNDLHLTTLSFAEELLSCIKPRVALIKSKILASLSRRLIPAQHVFEGYQAIPEQLTRSSEPYMICAVGVEEYRRLIPQTVQPKDVVLEVGCHFGRTTARLYKASSHCIGVDIGPKIIQNAKQQYPSIDFYVADARKSLELLKLRDDGVLGYDVVYADIGGLSGAHGALEALTLMESLASALEPKVIVIKSLCMKRLASQLRSFTLLWTKNGVDK